MKKTVEMSHIIVDWTRVEELIAILRPVLKLTNKMQSSQYTPGDFLYHFVSCIFTIEDIIIQSPVLKSVGNELQRDLEARKKIVMDSIQFKAAVYFDPRIVHSVKNFYSEEEFRMIEDFLVDLYNKMHSMGLVDPTAEDKDYEEPQTIREKFQEMRKRRCASRESSALDYWKGKRSKSVVSAVAAVVLSLPMSQYTVERAFGHLPLVIAERRSRFLGKSVDDILTVKFNRL